MKTPALVLTQGYYMTDNAKTAHGLVRGTDRFEIKALIDHQHATADAGELLDGRKRNIPILSQLEEALEIFPEVQYLIIGVATVGGVLPDEMLPIIEEALGKGISIVNGLHDYLNDREQLRKLAFEHGAELLDIRRPKKPTDLHFWTGEIFKVDVPIIAVMGMDCALGKRTTCRMIMEAGQKAGINIQMIYTGQTGWLQGGKYGFILDSTLNDFVSGELEHAILSCWKESNPDIILIEGQSALRNPSGPCGLEFLISGMAKQVILVHAPKRKYYEDEVHWGEIPTLASEKEILEKFDSNLIGLALNTHDCTESEARNFQQQYKEELEIPVLLPIIEGVEDILPTLKQLIAR
ncbi:MAG: DUF1611 domain-containing protein [Bacteroidia bacterium]|nr:DUF1611 domain-containing protein [Bacteroidia bacterium]